MRPLLHVLALLVVAFCSVLGVARAHADDDESAPIGNFATVRLTWYREGGLTYGGGHTYPGSAACSWNFPLGTVLQFAGGEQVTCNDRGLLGWQGWVDVFRQPALVLAYGSWAVVEVNP